MSRNSARFEWREIGPRLTVALAFIVTASLLALSQLAVGAFERAIEPELASRTRLVGAIVREAVQRPLERGIPFDALAGLDRYLAETLGRFEEVDRIAIVSVEGVTLAEAARTGPRSLLERAGIEALRGRAPAYSLPIVAGARLAGTIEVQVRPDFVRSRLRDVFLDVMVIALVATLIALELTLAVALATVGKPLRRVLRLLDEQRQGVFRHRIRDGGVGALGRVAARLNDHAEDLAERLRTLPATLRAGLPGGLAERIGEGRPARLRLSDIGDVRPALFMLSVGTEIAAAFLPVYARAAARPEWLAPEYAAAAPLLVYLVSIAALMPFGGALVRRFGARPLFVASMAPIAVALAAMGFAEDVVAIALCRGAIGLFYAVATIAAQEYALGATQDSSPARALGGYLGVVYAGVFGGSALGGVIAGRFGYEAAFLTAASLIIAAAGIAWATMTGRSGQARQASGTAVVVPAMAHLRLRHAALLCGIAMPMNAATAIFVWYLTPLVLAADGVRTADAARVVMLYYLATILLSPLVARFAERQPAVTPLIAGGAFAAGLALLSLSVWDGFWAMACAIAALGAAQTMIRVPQYVLALGIAAQGGPSTDSLRLFERLGAIAGLLAATFLLRDAGAEDSIRTLGIAVLCGAAGFAVTMGVASGRRG